MPVLPEVGSTMVPPFFSLPLVSASSTIARPMRSLMEPPGFARSDLIQTSAEGPKSRLTRMCGVLPIVARMLGAFIAGLGWSREATISDLEPFPPDARRAPQLAGRSLEDD